MNNNTNAFTQGVGITTLPPADMVTVRNLTKIELNKMISSLDPKDFDRVFGENRGPPISSYRMAMIKEKNLRTIQKPVEDGLLSSVWQGKMAIEMQPKKDVVEAVIISQDQKVATGTGPITTIKAVAPFMQRAILFLSCYTKDDEDRGVVSTIDNQLAKIFPNLNLQGVADIAMILQNKRKELKIPASDSTGLKWQSMLIELIGQFTMSEQVSLNNRILIDYLKQAKPDYTAIAKSGDYSWIAKSNQGSAKEASQTVIRNGHEVKIPLLAWTSDVQKVQIQLAVAANPQKFKCSFYAELGWAQATISALGSSNVMALSAASGLMPGITEQEAGTIRFVTVALNEFMVSKSIKVAAPSSMLLLLYYSLQAYLLANKVTKKDATELIKARVHFSSIGLKPGALMSFRELFSSAVDPQSVQTSSYISWNPSKFASAVDSMEVVKKSNAISSIFEAEAKGYSRKFIYREVLEYDKDKEKDRFLFIDGYPALFNFWSSNVNKMEAAILKDGNYSSEPLNLVPGSHTQLAYNAAKQLLAFPMQPFTKRSYRVMAVKGSKLLSVLRLEGIEDVLGKGNKEDEQGLSQVLALTIGDFVPQSTVGLFDASPEVNNTEIAPPTSTTTQDVPYEVSELTPDGNSLF